MRSPFRSAADAARAVLPWTLAIYAAAAAGAPSEWTVKLVPIPGATPAGVSMDYIAFDPATHQVWAPAGNTGTVAVVDAASGAVKSVGGFPTAEMGSGDRKRVVGPSSVAIGDKSVYVGNRADSSVCAFDPRTFEKGACHKFDSMPDGLVYVAARGEVWATTPRDKSIRVLDGATLEEKGKITLDGSPEGFAVDGKRGRFYTNLEDKDATLAIDLASHKTVATWKPNCGEDGPRGLRADSETGRVFVACTGRVEVLDGERGEVLSSMDTGEGVDDIDYAPSTHRLYVGAARAGRLTVARVDGSGKLVSVASVPTRAGARNPAVTDRGVVYLAHGGSSGLTDLVVVTPPE
jgi:DNA-binding beta-propeller fold protein YncE